MTKPSCPYVNVAFPNRLRGLFTYALPAQLQAPLRLGHCVEVNFRNKIQPAYVLQWLNETPLLQVKPILKIFSEQNLGNDLIQIIHWMAEYYFCDLAESFHVLNKFLISQNEPNTKRSKIVKSTVPSIRITMDDLSSVQYNAVQYLQNFSEGVPLKQYLDATGLTHSQLLRLKEKALIQIDFQEKRPDYYAKLPQSIHPRSHLNPDQQLVLDNLQKKIDSQKFHTVLLHGVTASGKTEIYIHSIQHLLQKNKTAICLVPEIALTPQLLYRFKDFFKNELVVIHSRLSQNERNRSLKQIYSGEVRIVMGTRSAVFAPLSNLGLIILDEEHDPSYKQSDQQPRYHAREVAIMRAKFSGATVILGSATPSLESYYNVKNNKFSLLELKSRADQRPFPAIEVLDMKEERQRGNWGIFSEKLLQRIEQNFLNHEQVLILLNRRGFSPFIKCKDCGNIVFCPACQITLTYHSSDRTLKCHYCNYTREAPSSCPQCLGKDILFKGVGIQKVELELKERFPLLKILRLDRDITRRRGSEVTIFEQFKSGQADLLLGTQMVAKGFDFPNITLVGVVSADVGLHLPDFRAQEKIFQLLTQVAGRGGRGMKSGEVIIQTYSPQDDSIQFAKEYNYQGFYEQEISRRDALHYPPFYHLLLLSFLGPHEKTLWETAKTVATRIQQDQAVLSQIETLGPAPFPIFKIRNQFRIMLLFKSPAVKNLKKIVRWMAMMKPLHPGIKMHLEIDPLSLY